MMAARRRFAVHSNAIQSECASLLVALSSIAIAGCSKDESNDKPPAACVAPSPPADATVKMGWNGSSFVLPGGRVLTPTGIHKAVGGFPLDVRAHPSLPVAYVANAGYAKRSLQVVDTATGDVVEDIARSDLFYGLSISPDGKRLYSATGEAQALDVYDIAADGKLTASAQVQVGGFPSGVAVSSDGARAYVGRFLENSVAEIDTSTLSVVGDPISLTLGAYGVALVPQKNELYVTAFRGDKVFAIDLGTRSVTSELTIQKNPQSLAVSPDGATVYVSVPDAHAIVAIDTATHTVKRTQPVGETTIADATGVPLPGSNPAGITLDAANNRLYAVRSADNAVTVLDPVSLEIKGSIPVGWYPTSVAVAGSKLVVTNGKGLSTGPTMGDESKEKMNGSLSVVDLATLDLAKATAEVERNVRRPDQVYGFKCEGSFPVPAKAGGKTPIEHIVLLVRENKTYDSELSDLEQGERDPSLLLFGEPITPNLHALARRFAHHDNFYDDSESSAQGHGWLTASFLTDVVERTWIEDYRNSGNGTFGTDPGTNAGLPLFGTFFTHLIKHGVSFRDYGEIVGALGNYEGQPVMDHVDVNFPGGFYNTNIKDEDKARYVIEKLVNQADFPRFVYLLLPNDHTNGTRTGNPTPESMINDNDYATGLVVEAISRSPFWEKTAIFIVEDDPQIGADHVEYHRSYCLVVSPWAKRGYISHVNASYPSLFRTFELVLGIPPMTRYDALATPLWDVFTTTPDTTPYTAIPRTVADEVNLESELGASHSARMDFSGPDRNPELGEVLWWYVKGAPRPGSALARELLEGDELEDAEEQAEERGERDLYEAHWAGLEAWLRQHPGVVHDIRRPPP